MRSIHQLARYVIVGGLLNAGWYLIYLLFTSRGMQPLVVVTALFPIALLASYLSHRKHTFKVGGHPLQGPALRRFVGLNLTGLALNNLLLYFLSTKLGAPHQFVQIMAMGVCSLYLFAGMKIFVFSGRPGSLRRFI